MLLFWADEKDNSKQLFPNLCCPYEHPPYIYLLWGDYVPLEVAFLKSNLLNGGFQRKASEGLNLFPQASINACAETHVDIFGSKEGRVLRETIQRSLNPMIAIVLVLVRKKQVRRPSEGFVLYALLPSLVWERSKSAHSAHAPRCIVKTVWRHQAKASEINGSWYSAASHAVIRYELPNCVRIDFDISRASRRTCFGACVTNLFDRGDGQLATDVISRCTSTLY